jgi:hypothetical protein
LIAAGPWPGILPVCELPVFRRGPLQAQPRHRSTGRRRPAFRPIPAVASRTVRGLKMPQTRTLRQAAFWADRRFTGFRGLSTLPGRWVMPPHSAEQCAGSAMQASDRRQAESSGAAVVTARIHQPLADIDLSEIQIGGHIAFAGGNGLSDDLAFRIGNGGEATAGDWTASGKVANWPPLPPSSRIFFTTFSTVPSRL